MQARRGLFPSPRLATFSPTPGNAGITQGNHRYDQGRQSLWDRQGTAADNPTTAESPLNSDIEPKISDYNSHGVHTVPPAAAKFGIGATTVEQIQQATDARREHSAQLSR